MRITINGVFAAGGRFGPSWGALQAVLRSMFDDDDAVLTRIARRDGQCNYRDSQATYDLTFRHGGSEVPVELVIQRQA